MPILVLWARGFFIPEGIATASVFLPPENSQPWGVAKRSSISWVAKFKGDNISECKLSNGWSRSYREIKQLLSAGNEWSRRYREINQHPNLPWNFMTPGFMDPSAFPETDFHEEIAVPIAKKNRCIKQQSEGPLTEDPSTQDSHHDHGRVFTAEATIKIKNFGRGAHLNGETHVFGNDSKRDNSCFMGSIRDPDICICLRSRACVRICLRFVNIHFCYTLFCGTLISSLQQIPRSNLIGAHSRVPALKTENFSKNRSS